MTRSPEAPPADIDRPPEFSYPVRAEEVPSGGKRFDLAADQTARAALAERLELAALDDLAGTLTLRPLAGGPMLLATGRFAAKGAQHCVVTLDPVPFALDQEIAVEFAPEESPEDMPGEQEFTLEDADPPEPIVDGVVDLGELLAQQLALSLDPYPRKPGVDLDDVLDDLPADRREAVRAPEPEGPFAELAKLRDGKG